MSNKIKNFKFATIKGDLFGGITAGVVALPLALAFGVQSGLGATAGLYGAIAMGIVASIFGGTKTQISGPTGPMTVVSAVFIATTIEVTGSLQAGMGMIIGTFLLAGGFQIVLGLLKIGQYVRYIPYPVVSGFMSGIGVIIILLQVFPLMGHPSPKTIPAIFTNIQVPLNAVNLQAVLLAACTIVIIYLFPRITKSVPSTLIALVCVTLAAGLLPVDVPKIGDIPVGLPKILWNELMGFDLSLFNMILMPAITLAALGAIDSLLTSVIADNITKTKHNSNRELIGQGLGNIFSSLIGGIPGAGATMRTVVNVNSGGRGRLSGVIHGVVLLLVLLGAGQYAAEIPLAVLAGILITVGIGIVDYKGIRHVAKVPKTDAAIMIIVLAVTVFGDLLQAVGVGMVLATVLFMKQMGDTANENTKGAPMEDFIKNKTWKDEENISAQLADQIYVKHLYGPLFFGFTAKFQEMIKAIPDVKVVVIRMERVPFIDQSGLYALEDAIFDLHQKGVKVALTGLKPQPKLQLEKIRLIPTLIGREQLFENFAKCSTWAAQYLKQQEPPSVTNK
jgi:SulP family sulfate permease